jgi:ABC-type amino acid transport system permease subunit
MSDLAVRVDSVTPRVPQTAVERRRHRNQRAHAVSAFVVVLLPGLWCLALLLSAAMFAPICLAAQAGVRSVPIERVHTAQSLGARPWQLFAYIVPPSAWAGERWLPPSWWLPPRGLAI